ncbi:MAG: protein kinase [Planctomycetota bacterium]
MTSESIDCPSRDELTRFLTEDEAAPWMELIEEHLSSCEKCMRTLETIDADIVPALPRLSTVSMRQQATSKAPTQPENRNLGTPEFTEFEIGDCIGKGGFGTVYCARQLSTDGREVAVKVLHGTTEEIGSAVEKEISVLARLKHEGIAQIYQTVRGDDGRFGIVMEFVDGPSLDVFARDESVDVQTRFDVAETLCRVVEYIHSQQIHHRDLTPRNVMIAIVGERHVPKVIDFGLSALSTQWHARVRSGAGTLEYMSPEQSGSIEGPISKQTDVYALGLCILELLTGNKPAPIGNGESRADFVERRFATDFQLPKLVDDPRIVNFLGRNRAGELDLVVRKATAIGLTDRYRNASELLQDFEAAFRFQPTTIRRDDRVHRAGLFIRRHRIGLATVFVFIAVGGFALYFGFKGEQERQRADSVLNAWSDAMTEFAESGNPLLSKPDESTTSSQTVEMAEVIAEKARDKEFGNEDAMLAARLASTETLRALDECEQAVPALEQLVKDVVERFGEESDETVTVRLHLGLAYLRVGRFKEAQQILLDAGHLWHKRYGLQDIRFGCVAHYISVLEFSVKNYENAISWCDENLSNYGSQDAPDPLLIALIHDSRGNAKFKLKRWESALQDYRVAEATFLGLTRPTSPVVLRVQSSIALTLSDLKQCDEAKQLINDVVRRYGEALPRGAKETDQAIINKAVVLARCGDFDRAVEVLQSLVKSTQHEDVRWFAMKEAGDIEAHQRTQSKPPDEGEGTP